MSKLLSPLSNIQVLDFSRFLPAPYCSMILGDYGADVIRIEQPKEVLKQEKAFGRDKLSEEKKRELKRRENLTRNKRSVLLNLRNSEACEVAKKMMASTDVVIHDYRQGVMEAMGLGYDEIKKINPKIIYCCVSVSGSPESGCESVYDNMPGHEPIALALSGALPRFGDGKTPHIAGLPIGDIGTGMQATIGILLALRSRDISGDGQFVDVAMTDCALAQMTSVFQRYLVDEKEPPLHWKGGNVGLWKTKDDQYICTTDLEPNYWKIFCQAIDRVDLIPMQFDFKQSDYLKEELTHIFLQKTRDEWFELLREKGTQVAPVYSLAEALNDPHSRARGTVVDIKDDDGNTITQVTSGIKLSKTPSNIRHLSHQPGEDTFSILNEMGFTNEQIEALQK
ncbi:MAG: CoA transferase [Cellvibrionaceae bacterium]